LLFPHPTSSRNLFVPNRTIAGSEIIQDSTCPRRNNLFRLIDAGAVARSAATVQATKTKRASAFRNWRTFLNSIRLEESVYLDGYSQFQRNILMAAFAQAVREAAFTPRPREHLVEGTVSASLSYVAQAFRSNNRKDPRLDADGKTCFLIQEQLRAYRNQDGSRNKQKALPMSVLRKLNELAETRWDKAVSQLLIGAIFFAMRSCEYLKTTSRDGAKRTKILRLRNILFKKQGKILPHSSTDLHTADLVRITFEYQKNDKRDVSIHMFSTNDDVLNPVTAWASTVYRVRQIPEATDETTVCTFQLENGKTTQISSDHVRTKLRSIVDLIGLEELGFSKEEIGLHSIRSGGAMAMFLSGTAVIIIMRIGRWSSEAFLEYIREQVESFTMGVSQRMLQYEAFFNLNSTNTPDTDTAGIEEISSPANENGMSSVPFRVNFNSLALGESPGNTEG
jgi:hypothetical protein